MANYCERCGLTTSTYFVPNTHRMINRPNHNRTDYTRVLIALVLVVGALMALGMVTNYYSSQAQQQMVVTQQAPPIVVQQPAPSPPTIITVTSQTTVVQQNPPIVVNNAPQCYAYDVYGNCVNYTPPTYLQPYPVQAPQPTPRPWYQWSWHWPGNNGGYQQPPHNAPRTPPHR